MNSQAVTDARQVMAPEPIAFDLPPAPKMDDDLLSFPGAQPGSGFVIRIVTIAPGSSRAYDDAEWLDTVAVVESGEVELECLAGDRRRFGRGAVLWLTGLGLRTLHNRGEETVVLAALSRHQDDCRTEG
ncbi:MAG: hypothetical protein ACRDRH_07925 [Pseudonocardia sp.]